MTIDQLLKFPVIQILDKVYPVVYFDEGALGKFRVDASTSRIEIYNPRCQWDIDKALLHAYLKLHKGDSLEP